MRSLVLLLVLVVSGCAAAPQVIGPDRLGVAGFALDGRSGTVVLVDGARYSAQALVVQPDTTSWIDPDTGDLRLVATPFIAEIEHRDRGRSALRTAGRGALVGVLVGAVLGIAVCADVGCGELAPIVVATAGLMSAPGGAMWGGIIGALDNPPQRWLFIPPDEAPIEE